MTRERNSQLVSRHSVLSRVLSVLLLGFIFYGTTVEAAHAHTKPVRPSAADVSVPQHDTDSSVNLLGCGDCLICQLHQNFSTGILSAAPELNPTTLSSHFFKLNTVTVHSHISTPQIGRGPPLSL